MEKRFYFGLVITLLLVLPVAGQNDTIDLSGLIGDSSTRLFDSDDLLELILEFDVTRLSRTKHTNDNQEAVMTYYVPGKDTVTRIVRVRARGEFRRNYCDFPPIRLDLRKDDLPGDLFNQINRIKLVTHCKAGRSDYIMREFLVYKIYNLLTDFSFRVRLLKINYINVRRPQRPITEYAFLIEPVEFLAARTRTLEIESPRLSQKLIIPEHMDRVAIFNFMIGNYDWAVPGQQNLVVLSRPLSEQSNLGIAVPYDFDYCGLVNTSYAIPPETLPIKSVRERMYRGICRSEDEFRKGLNEFLGKKEEIYKVIREFPYISERSKRDMINYLGTFYRDLEERNIILQIMLRNCVDL
ncbi:MAG: hypothetical protein R6W81_04965 [Bacteroidales bacterium]